MTTPLVQIYFSSRPSAAIKIKDGGHNFRYEIIEHSPWCRDVPSVTVSQEKYIRPELLDEFGFRVIIISPRIKLHKTSLRKLKLRTNFRKRDWSWTTKYLKIFAWEKPCMHVLILFTCKSSPVEMLRKLHDTELKIYLNPHS